MEDKYFSLEDLLKLDIKCQARYNIKKAMNHFGIEATEEKIKDLYSNMPKIKEIMLNEYKLILKGNNEV